VNTINPIEKLSHDSFSTTTKKDKDAWLHNLRKNSVLTWVEELENVLKYKDILDTAPLSSSLETESGIVKIVPGNRYIGHTFIPYFKAGFTFLEVSVLLRARIVLFESQYGKIILSDKEIYNLKELVYQFNRQFSSVDMLDKKKLIHLEHSAEVLYYLMGTTITLDAQTNGCCTLTFTNGGITTKDYCTIFTEDQIRLLTKVNNSIVPQSK
jgi:hypothetical protein